MLGQKFINLNNPWFCLLLFLLGLTMSWINFAFFSTYMYIHTILGWRPRRTILFASWDAEEFGLLGSTEWAEVSWSFATIYIFIMRQQFELNSQGCECNMWIQWSNISCSKINKDICVTKELSSIWTFQSQVMSVVKITLFSGSVIGTK